MSIVLPSYNINFLDLSIGHIHIYIHTAKPESRVPQLTFFTRIQCLLPTGGPYMLDKKTRLAIFMVERNLWWGVGARLIIVTAF